jgi:methenyltetrahydrofolate cyclohydrolase
MKLTAHTLTDLLAAFRSPEPMPGGGSAAALAGALGASLLAMVAGLPRSRTSTPDEAARLADAGARCTAIAAQLAELVDRDSAAYGTVMAAFRMPKRTDEEKAARSATIQEATRSATEAPLGVMRACAEAIRQAGDVAAFGNTNAASDVQVALELLGAGLRGARHNVAINLESLKDAGYVARVTGETDRLGADAERDVLAARARF